jgi:hypothetical protein
MWFYRAVIKRHPCVDTVFTQAKSRLILTMFLGLSKKGPNPHFSPKTLVCREYVGSNGYVF